MKHRNPLLEWSERRQRLVGKRHPPLKVAGLFAGIGGIELGLSRASHETLLLNEIDEPALAVLRHRFSSVRLQTDVKKLGRLPKETELVTAGFPCQDLSQAGRTRGISGSQSGLVGEVFRLLKRKRVPWLLIENVPFMLRLGRGRALDVIVSELERLGYHWAYRVVDSRAFGLPQRRERVYLLASTDGDPRSVLFADEQEAPKDKSEDWRRVACGFYWTEGVRGLGWAVNAVPTIKGGSSVGIPSPPAVVFPSGLVVKPEIEDLERLQGFQAGWTEPAERVARRGSRYRLVGNAVTVDAAHWIGERLRCPGDFDDEARVSLDPGSPWPNAAFGRQGARFAVHSSKWPLNLGRPPLSDFLLSKGTPLSPRATKGFLSRANSSSLRFPKGFIRVLERHLDRMEEVAL